MKMYYLKLKTHEAARVFENWLDNNAKGMWEVVLEDMSDIDESTGINQTEKVLLFSFEHQSDKESFIEAYKSRKIF